MNMANHRRRCGDSSGAAPYAHSKNRLYDWRLTERSTMSYREICRVTAEHDGTPINLKLQWRLNEYHCLSWRTLYPRGRTNRQFYRLVDTGVWTIPVQVASHLMRQAEDCGILDTRYDDPQVRHDGPANCIVDSRTLRTREHLDVFDVITCDQGEHEWGDDPVFVIIEVPDGTWRKIMIVDAERKLCTFRSTTSDPSYGGATITDGVTPPWRLDNNMQDASAAMIREFLSTLREL